MANLNLRVADEDKLSWQASASAEGISLTELIVRRMKGEHLDADADHPVLDERGDLRAEVERIRSDLDGLLDRPVGEAAGDTGLDALEERIKTWVRREIEEAEYRLAEEIAASATAPLLTATGLPPGYTPVGNRAARRQDLPGQTAPSTALPPDVVSKPWGLVRVAIARVPQCDNDGTEAHAVGVYCAICGTNGLVRDQPFQAVS